MLGVLFAGLLDASLGLGGAETALDRYVRRPDPTYAWKVVQTVPGTDQSQFVIDLKSQTWRTEKEVSQPLWQHWLTVVKPAKPVSSTAFLLVVGGRNGRDAPDGADERTRFIARETGAVVAELRMVPNQPLVFHGDGQGRSEDDLIGYTWDQFLKTEDETWPARLPMVKSAVRAMDCVQELLRSEPGGHVRIEKFVVMGGSKRGWTTWCTAAVDPRVVAIIPAVIDVLNVVPSLKHHAAAYGFYSLALGNYFEHRILQRMDHPRTQRLLAIEDPYSYRDRLILPKYILNAAGDQFFCPDSSQFYFEALKGEKHLRYVPNADHSLKGSDAVESMIAFYQMVLAGQPRPQYTWTFEKDGAIRVQTKTTPQAVRLWRATNPKARDFRLATFGKGFSSQPLEPQPGGIYLAPATPPEKGWTALFVELTFDTGMRFPLKVTTAVRVLPERRPHADLDPAHVPLERKPPAQNEP